MMCCVTSLPSVTTTLVTLVLTILHVVPKNYRTDKHCKRHSWRPHHETCQSAPLIFFFLAQDQSGQSRARKIVWPTRTQDLLHLNHKQCQLNRIMYIMSYSLKTACYLSAFHTYLRVFSPFATKCFARRRELRES